MQDNQIEYNIIENCVHFLKDPSAEYDLRMKIKKYAKTMKLDEFIRSNFKEDINFENFAEFVFFRNSGINRYLVREDFYKIYSADKIKEIISSSASNETLVYSKLINDILEGGILPMMENIYKNLLCANFPHEKEGSLQKFFSLNTAMNSFTEMFEQIEEIGGGSCGTVYKMKHRKTGTLLAVKKVNLYEIKKLSSDETSKSSLSELPDDYLELSKLSIETVLKKVGDGALREVSMIEGLKKAFNIKNIVLYYRDWIDINETDIISLYITMELCDYSLAKWLEDPQITNNELPTNCQDNLIILGNIVDGLEFIHRRGIIHCDLTPYNILYSSKFSAWKISDFGFSTFKKNFGIKNSTCFGNNFTSPEQHENKYYDEKADIYPVGLIYMLLLSKFETDEYASAHWYRTEAIKNLREKSQFPAQYEEEFPHDSKLIISLLDKDPNNRPSSEELSLIFLKANICFWKKWDVNSLKDEKYSCEFCIESNEKFSTLFRDIINQSYSINKQIKQFYDEYIPVETFKEMTIKSFKNYSGDSISDEDVNFDISCYPTLQLVPKENEDSEEP